ncbi:MAG: zf-HC2 domain-containing protein [Planctomycetes bacterium]|nr:zf-HC2 domain-containing protein [Planctomycetota bacterium]
MTDSRAEDPAPLDSGRLDSADPCALVRPDLVAFLDEELAPERATAVRAHLGICSACQAESDALDGAWKALDVLPGLAPRAGLFAEIEATVRATASAAVPGGVVVPFPGPSRARPVLLQRAVGLAAAALVTAGLGFGAAYLVRAQTPTPQPSGGQVALHPVAVQPVPSRKTDLPSPLNMGHSPERTPIQDGSDRTSPDERSPRVPRVKIPTETPAPDDRRPEVAVASAEWAALDPEEREIVENLELLIALEDVDDLEVVEALDALDDLTDEELGEG